MYSVVSSYMVPYLMMHMKGIPKTMQNPYYDDIVSEVIYYFSDKIKKARLSGIQ